MPGSRDVLSFHSQDYCWSNGTCLADGWDGDTLYGDTTVLQLVGGQWREVGQMLQPRLAYAGVLELPLDVCEWWWKKEEDKEEIVECPIEEVPVTETNEDPIKSSDRTIGDSHENTLERPGNNSDSTVMDAEGKGKLSLEEPSIDEDFETDTYLDKTVNDYSVEKLVEEEKLSIEVEDQMSSKSSTSSFSTSLRTSEEESVAMNPFIDPNKEELGESGVVSSLTDKETIRTSHSEKNNDSTFILSEWEGFNKVDISDMISLSQVLANNSETSGNQFSASPPSGLLQHGNITRSEMARTSGSSTTKIPSLEKWESTSKMTESSLIEEEIKTPIETTEATPFSRNPRATEVMPKTETVEATTMADQMFVTSPGRELMEAVSMLTKTESVAKTTQETKNSPQTGRLTTIGSTTVKIISSSDVEKITVANKDITNHNEDVWMTDTDQNASYPKHPSQHNSVLENPKNILQSSNETKVNLKLSNVSNFNLINKSTTDIAKNNEDEANQTVNELLPQPLDLTYEFIVESKLEERNNSLKREADYDDGNDESSIGTEGKVSTAEDNLKSNNSTNDALMEPAVTEGFFLDLKNISLHHEWKGEEGDQENQANFSGFVKYVEEQEDHLPDEIIVTVPAESTSENYLDPNLYDVVKNEPTTPATTTELVTTTVTTTTTTSIPFINVTSEEYKNASIFGNSQKSLQIGNNINGTLDQLSGSSLDGALLALAIILGILTVFLTSEILCKTLHRGSCCILASRPPSRIVPQTPVITMDWPENLSLDGSEFERRLDMEVAAIFGMDLEAVQALETTYAPPAPLVNSMTVTVHRLPSSSPLLAARKILCQDTASIDTIYIENELNPASVEGNEEEAEEEFKVPLSALDLQEESSGFDAGSLETINIENELNPASLEEEEGELQSAAALDTEAESSFDTGSMSNIYMDNALKPTSSEEEDMESEERPKPSDEPTLQSKEEECFETGSMETIYIDVAAKEADVEVDAIPEKAENESKGEEVISFPLRRSDRFSSLAKLEEDMEDQNIKEDEYQVHQTIVGVTCIALAQDGTKNNDASNSPRQISDNSARVSEKSDEGIYTVGTEDCTGLSDADNTSSAETTPHDLMTLQQMSVSSNNHNTEVDDEDLEYTSSGFSHYFSNYISTSESASTSSQDLSTVSSSSPPPYPALSSHFSVTPSSHSPPFLTPPPPLSLEVEKRKPFKNLSR